jgi:hypothetical protein
MDSRHIDTLKEKYDGIVSGFVCLIYPILKAENV